MIPNATNQDLTLTSIQFTDAGLYYVVVSNPDPINGKIVLMPVSVSNGYGAWHRGDENDTSTTFMTRANANPARNPKLFIAYGFEY